jgi:hypothetical protein
METHQNTQNSAEDLALIAKLTDPRYMSRARKTKCLEIGHVTDSGNEIVGYSIYGGKKLQYTIKNKCCGFIRKRVPYDNINSNCKKCVLRNNTREKHSINIGDVFGTLKVICKSKTDKNRLVLSCECLRCGYFKNYAKSGLIRIKRNKTGGCAKCGCIKACLSSADLRYLGAGNKVSITTFNSTILSANRRDIPFKLSLEDFYKLVKQPCYLCRGKTSDSENLDRIDNLKGYNKENVQSCCTKCNIFKWDLELKTCIKKVFLLLGFVDGACDHNKNVPDKYLVSYARGIVSRQKYNRNRKSHYSHKPELLLSLEEICEITVKPCHYCGQIDLRKSQSNSKTKIPVNGIDRIDSLGNYEKSNVLPCCESCNNSKNAYSYSEFFLTAWDIYKQLPLQYLPTEDLTDLYYSLSPIAPIELRICFQEEIAQRLDKVRDLA